MSRLLRIIQGSLGRVLVDKSGLTSLIDIPGQTFDVGSYEIGPNAVSVWPEIFRQLGFELQSGREAVETVVFDRVERPSEN